ncbi:MAG: glycosyltransferase family 1 protein [Bacteroidetes bacterium]|nr:glycosyltransferase family 1 protein [Bacteroidota bacterium]
MKKRIAINTRLLLKDKLEGIGVFGHEVLSRMTQAHPEVDFHFLFDRPFDPMFIYGKNVTGHVLFPQARHPILYYLWSEWVVKRKLDELQPNLFLSIDGLRSLRSDVKQLAVMHDINFEHHPEYLPWLTGRYYRHYFPRFAKKATRLATVSEYSKKDICQSYGIHKDKVDVVFNGASDSFRPLTEPQRKVTRIELTQGAPYLIYVGALQPRKNIGRMMKAFDAYKIANGTELKLLITGEKKWWSSEQEKIFEGLTHKDDIRFTGRLSQQNLVKALGASEGLLYVSTFEGFGIPILEAMHVDVPVLTSKVSAMPEVGGDAVVYCDPFSVESIRDGILEIMNDKRRGELIEKSRIQRTLFSWDKSADLLWQSIEQAWG